MAHSECSSGQEVWAGGQLFMKESTLCICPDLLAASHCSTGQEAVRMLLCWMKAQWLPGVSVNLKCAALPQGVRWAGCCRQPSIAGAGQRRSECCPVQGACWALCRDIKVTTCPPA